MKKLLPIALLSIFLTGCGSDSGSDSSTPTPPTPPTEAPLDPVLPEEPIFIIDPIDPGFGVDPIDPGFGTDPILPELPVNIAGDIDTHVEADGSIVGYANGSSVWVYSEVSGTNKLSDYSINVDIDFPSSKFMNIYLQKGEGRTAEKVRVDVTTAESWALALESYGDWTVRNYTDTGATQGLIRGNFIVRLGDSIYEGYEEFTIRSYEVTIK